ncbi:MAG: M3 family metallopeptidase [Elusimicrobiota bacterium]
MPPAARDFADTPEAIEAALTDLEEAAAPLLLIAHISTLPASIAASEACAGRMNAFLQDAYADRELYRALQQYAARREPLDGEPRLLLSSQLAEFQSRGAGLDSDRNRELRFLEERIAALENAFSDALGASAARLMLSAEELSGFPAALLPTLPRNGANYQIPAASEYYLPFLTTVQDRTARQRMEFIYHNRAALANGRLLQEILELRRRYARMLGRDSYAQYLQASRMTALPTEAEEKIKDMARGLKSPAQSLLNGLRKTRDQDLGEKGGRYLAAWDRPYYLDQQRRQLYPDQDAAISAFFPLDQVKANAFSILQRFLGLRLNRLPSTASWRRDVELYEVRDAGSGSGPGDILGYFYLDLAAGPGRRPGVFVLSHGHNLPDGGYRVPVCVLWAGPPAADGRRLMRHGRTSDVENLLHGLGHALTVILSHPRYARFSGANLSSDFSEVLPLVLSRLSWLPDVAAALSGHYLDASRRLPPELLSAAQAARSYGSPLRTLEAAAFALFDLEANSDSIPSDPGKLWRKLFQRTALLPTTAGTHPQTGALRLVQSPAGLSDALLSRIYAEAVWQRLQEEGLLNPVTGRHLRETLLRPGAGEEAQRLRNFLGRIPGYGLLPDPAAWPLPDWDAPAPAARDSLPRRRLLY